MSLLSFVGGAGQGLARSFGGFSEFANQQIQLNADLAAKRALAEQATLNAERERREVIVQGVNNANNNLQELMSVTANVDAAQLENANALINERLNQVRSLLQRPEYANAWRKQFIPGVQLSEEEHRMNREIRVITAGADAIRQQAENQYAAMQEQRKLVMEGKLLPGDEYLRYFDGDRSVTLRSPSTAVAAVNVEGYMNSLQDRVKNTAAQTATHYVSPDGFVVNSSTKQSDPVFVTNIVYEQLMTDVNALNALAKSYGVYTQGYVPADQRESVARALAAKIAPTLRFSEYRETASESARRQAEGRQQAEMAVTPQVELRQNNPQGEVGILGGLLNPFGVQNIPGAPAQRIVADSVVPLNKQVRAYTLDNNSLVYRTDGSTIPNSNIRSNILNNVTVQGVGSFGFVADPITGVDRPARQGEQPDYYAPAIFGTGEAASGVRTSGYGASGGQESSTSFPTNVSFISRNFSGVILNQAQMNAVTQKSNAQNARLQKTQTGTVDEMFNALNY